MPSSKLHRLSQRKKRQNIKECKSSAQGSLCSSCSSFKKCGGGGGGGGGGGQSKKK